MMKPVMPLKLEYMYLLTYIMILKLISSRTGLQTTLPATTCVCPGFVRDNSSKDVPGQAVTPPSVYDGEQRYIILTIQKDENTGDWSLYREDDSGNRERIGFWPKTLFTSLATSGAKVEWGGTVFFTEDDKQDVASPPMGSGHFPVEGEGKAASFKNVKLFDENGRIYSKPVDVRRLITADDCYLVSEFQMEEAMDHGNGYMFYYGGPGGCGF
ncbi:protein neprosin-like [Typha angustifolia]|uniref:protein neprosin-like n=1 Tax=Typha angustifolia TaxID=59011 RepID=UPI003C2FEB3A